MKTPTFDLNKPIHIGTIELYFIDFTPACRSKMKQLQKVFPKLKQTLKYLRTDGNRVVYKMDNNAVNTPREVLDGCQRLFRGVAHIKSYDGCHMQVFPDTRDVLSVEIRETAVGDAA